MSILDELYEWYNTKACYHPKKWEAQKQFCKAWEWAEKTLDEEHEEELSHRIFEYVDEECRQDFQAGFRLGVLLMLELQIPAIPANTEPQGLWKTGNSA